MNKYKIPIGLNRSKNPIPLPGQILFVFFDNIELNIRTKQKEYDICKFVYDNKEHLHRRIDSVLFFYKESSAPIKVIIV